MTIDDTLDQTPEDDENAPKSSDWIRSLIGKDEATVRAALITRWDSIDGFLAPLAEVLIESKPVSVEVNHHEGGTVCLHLPKSGKRLYLPGPPNETAINQWLVIHGFPSGSPFCRILSVFGGLTEDIFESGGFAHNQNDLEFMGYFRNHPAFEEIEGTLSGADWGKAVPGFYALDGSRLLFHPSNQVAWWDFYGHSISPLGTVDQVVSRYARVIATSDEPVTPQIPAWAQATPLGSPPTAAN